MDLKSSLFSYDPSLLILIFGRDLERIRAVLIKRRRGRILLTVLYHSSYYSNYYHAKMPRFASQLVKI